MLHHMAIVGLKLIFFCIPRSKRKLNVMEIRRSMNSIAAVDVIVEEQMKVDQTEPIVAAYVEELLSRRKQLQMRIGTLHDEIRNLDTLPED